jgi:hypothetical protein
MLASQQQKGRHSGEVFRQVEARIVTSRFRLVLAALGLVGLAGWLVYVYALDLRLFVFLDGQEQSVAFWALRTGLPACTFILGVVALVRTVQQRSARIWFLAVFVLLLGPMIVRGLPARLSLLPAYLLSAFYLLASLMPGAGQTES